jgi:ubiquinone/menaquinone biosynthesis C-methylase UbiE
MSERYTHGHHQSVLRSHRWRTVDNSAAYLLADLRPGLEVLDVGCGPGTITADLARRVAPGRVLGIERAAEVLEGAERGPENLEYAVGNIYRLDLADDSFDLVHAHQVLQHLVDPVAALREMRRVCRPGGLVAARDSDYSTFTWWPETPGLRAWLDLYHRLARANGAEPDAGRQLLAWAQGAGFEHVQPSASVWCYATAEQRQWWGQLWAERVRASAFADQALEQGVESSALERMAEAWLAWAEDPSGWFAVVHGEIRARA